ncbi:MAG: hypothetical protein GEU92_03890 [Alphaproteobacteria bacterium]|nr:hypothetical protein [Alphaproteobacteria bacterium]
MPSHPFRLIPVGAIALLLAVPAVAGEGHIGAPTVRDAGAVIGECESRYRVSLDSRQRREMESGYLGVVRCLRAAALEDAVLLLGEERRARIAESFEQIEKGFERFYTTLNDGALGTFEPFWASALRDAYADILHDVLRQRSLRAPM